MGVASFPVLIPVKQEELIHLLQKYLHSNFPNRSVFIKDTTRQVVVNLLYLTSFQVIGIWNLHSTVFFVLYSLYLYLIKDTHKKDWILYRILPLQHDCFMPILALNNLHMGFTIH